MSYADDIRGALAATSGVSRRVQALRELGLPEDENHEIESLVDQAVNCLILVADRLKVYGMLGATNSTMAQAAKTARTNRLMEAAERPWKSVKERVAEARTPAPKNSPAEVAQAPQDVAHPWRADD